MEKGIWKPAPHVLIEYNQLELDAYACTWVSVITACSNLLNVRLTSEQMKDGWADFVLTGKFVPHFGAKVVDSAPHAIAYFNRVTGNSLNGSFDKFSRESIVRAMASGKAATLGIHASPKLIEDIQADGIVDNPRPKVSEFGHALALVKLNTMDDFLFKTLDNYAGKVYKGLPYKNVALWELPDDAAYFQSWLYVISK